MIGDLLVSPDGIAPDNASFVPGVAWADGTVCGTKSDQDGNGLGVVSLSCIAGDGQERSMQSEQLLGSSSGGAWVATDSAVWTVTAGEILGMTRIDLATLEGSSVSLPGSPRGTVKVRFGPEGTPYLVFTDQGFHAILRVDDDGPKAIEIPDLALMAGSLELDLLVEEELFLIVSLVFDPPDVLRVPRNGR